MLRILILFLSFNLLSDVNKFIDASSKKYDQLALDLWDYAEMGYQEVKSSNALKKVLKEEGFSIRSNIAGIPTAFIAEYNNGGPVIAILAEYDALPGLSQNNVPYRESVGGEAGHACGHNLFWCWFSSCSCCGKKMAETNKDSRNN